MNLLSKLRANEKLDEISLELLVKTADRWQDEFIEAVANYKHPEHYEAIITAILRWADRYPDRWLKVLKLCNVWPEQHDDTADYNRSKKKDYVQVQPDLEVFRRQFDHLTRGQRSFDRSRYLEPPSKLVEDWSRKSRYGLTHTEIVNTALSIVNYGSDIWQRATFNWLLTTPLIENLFALGLCTPDHLWSSAVVDKMMERAGLTFDGPYSMLCAFCDWPDERYDPRIGEWIARNKHVPVLAKAIGSGPLHRITDEMFDSFFKAVRNHKHHLCLITALAVAAPERWSLLFELARKYQAWGALTAAVRYANRESCDSYIRFCAGTATTRSLEVGV